MKGLFYLSPSANHLVPEDDEARLFVAKLGVGEVVQLSVLKGREVQNLRRYWKICDYIAQSCPGVESRKQVDHVLKIETGHVEVFKVGDTLYQQPGSIAFDKMDEDAFNEFLKKAVKVILTLFLPNMTDKTVVEEVERMVGVSR